MDLGIIQRAIRFISDVRIELFNVSWLSRKEVITTTSYVLSIAVATSLFLFGLDLLFEKILLILLGK